MARNSKIVYKVNKKTTHNYMDEISKFEKRAFIYLFIYGGNESVCVFRVGRGILLSFIFFSLEVHNYFLKYREWGGMNCHYLWLHNNTYFGNSNRETFANKDCLFYDIYQMWACPE